MKLLSAKDYRDVEVLSSERAGGEDVMVRKVVMLFFVWWSGRSFSPQQKIQIVCGSGNNGLDGLAIAAEFNRKGYSQVEVFHLRKEMYSPLMQEYLDDLQKLEISVTHFSTAKEVEIDPEALVLDCLMGTGVNSSIKGELKKVVQKINSAQTIISLDLPSGLPVDLPLQAEDTVVQADYTLTLGLYKKNLLLSDYAHLTGDVFLLPLPYDKQALREAPSQMTVVESEEIKSFLKKRLLFSHKGDYGTALLIGGQEGMFGSIGLAVTGCMYAGAGKTIVHTAASGVAILQSKFWDVVCSVDLNQHHVTGVIAPDASINIVRDMNQYSAVGIGPGYGTHVDSKPLLKQFLEHCRVPLVLDADALNCIAEEGWIEAIPEGSVLTPHPGEFERLFGFYPSTEEKISVMQDFCRRKQSVIVYKSAYTIIVVPDGHVYFNNSGNPAMAKAGTGDVLTGMIAGFLSRGYETIQAVLLGVYTHGRAGDLSLTGGNQESLLASALAEHISQALDELYW